MVVTVAVAVALWIRIIITSFLFYFSYLSFMSCFKFLTIRWTNCPSMREERLFLRKYSRCVFFFSGSCCFVFWMSYLRASKKSKANIFPHIKSIKKERKVYAWCIRIQRIKQLIFRMQTFLLYIKCVCVCVWTIKEFLHAMLLANGERKILNFHFSSGFQPCIHSKQHTFVVHPKCCRKQNTITFRTCFFFSLSLTRSLFVCTFIEKLFYTVYIR